MAVPDRLQASARRAWADRMYIPAQSPDRPQTAITVFVPWEPLSGLHHADRFGVSHSPRAEADG
ncbi:hypothetical protein BIV24_10370 [Streptomyces colonosanans]|uniref:Uncharacterized protein n=1 Tax=Streptomyces colonosanans TaxID=1428652 RepID=A0A1S2PMC0_9ACTN|nr:hypothetical protein BIV24_10370 [Streptomyces colonosanans]